jgi:hypothetical protein
MVIRPGTIVTQLVTQRIRGPFRNDQNWPLTCGFGVGVAVFEPTASSSRTAGRAVDGGCLHTSRAAERRYGTVLVSLVAVFRSCTADVVRWSKLASSTSGSEWQCFTQFWPPWGVGAEPKAFPKVESVIDLGQEVR